MMIQDSKRATALHWACAQGYIEVEDVLLECGLEVNALDNNGFSALIIAAE
jgi:ankyrin repeat protein